MRFHPLLFVMKSFAKKASLLAKVPSLTLLAVALGSACTDPTSGPIPSGRLTLEGTVAFSAEGAPQFSGEAVIPATFATAVADSTGTIFILAYRKKNDGNGEYFSLWLDQQRAGSFAPCTPTPPDASGFAPAPKCSAFLDTNHEPEPPGLVRSGATLMTAIDGDVQVSEFGDRIVGTTRLKLFSNPDSTVNSPLLVEGTFDLPLLRGNQTRLLVCFAQNASGAPCSY